MIPRYQRVLYWLLVVGILLMGLLMVRGCQRRHQRIADARDQSPIPAPNDAPPEAAMIASASDDDGTVTLDQVTLALPQDPSLRARALLARMFANFASPDSLHPVPAGPAVDDVFLLPLPLATSASEGLPSPSVTPYGLGNAAQAESSLRHLAIRSHMTSPYGLSHPADSQLAVVNLTKAFADAHPSGIESEELTLQAIIATLQANLPHVDEVLFLVDGQSRDTLNGHADLTHPYSVVEPAKMIHILSPDGDPL